MQEHIDTKQHHTVLLESKYSEKKFSDTVSASFDLSGIDIISFHSIFKIFLCCLVCYKNICFEMLHGEWNFRFCIYNDEKQEQDLTGSRL